MNEKNYFKSARKAECVAYTADGGENRLIEKLFNKIYSLVISQMNIFSFIFVLVCCIIFLIGIILYLRMVNINKNLMILDSVFMFILYVGIIYYMTVFGRSKDSDTMNLIPFFNIIDYFKGNRFNVTEFIGNILNIILFMPVGFILGMFDFKIHKIKTALGISFLISLSIEITQYITSRGQAMTDDVICNTLGGVLGCYLFIMFSRIFIKSTED